MEAPKASDSANKEDIENDLKQEYKKILLKHLDGREYKEEKIKSWIDNILVEAKEYFEKKYPVYNLFLYCNACEKKKVSFRQNGDCIGLHKSYAENCWVINIEGLYATLRFFFYKDCNLTYSLDNIESDIIQKGDEVLSKYLDERKFIYEKLDGYNNSINKEHIDFIFEKEKCLRCYLLNQIFKNPIGGKFCFKYLSHGKNIYSKIFQTYVNDSLISHHSIFFCQ